VTSQVRYFIQKQVFNNCVTFEVCSISQKKSFPNFEQPGHLKKHEMKRAETKEKIYTAQRRLAEDESNEEVSDSGNESGSEEDEVQLNSL
jgi:hypothetical protein